MAPVTKKADYVIDPDGEVIFVLEVPNAPFAVWDEERTDRPATRRPEETEEPAQRRIRLSETKVSLMAYKLNRIHVNKSDN